MDIQMSKEGSTLVLALTGKLDAVTAPEFEKKVNELLAAESCVLIVDCERLDYISSAGLRALLATAKRSKSRGGQVRCANVTGSVREVFDISGFSTIFPMHDSVAGAVAAVE
jgi:anti-anti-sigma factor